MLRKSQSHISALESEISDLRDEIDIFIARGESPIIRDDDGSLPSVISIRNVTSIAHSLHSSNVHRDNYQNEYTDVLEFRVAQGNFRTLLDGRYSRLRGTAFVRYGESRSGTSTLRFEIDGRVITPSHAMDRATRPIDIDIDLEHGNEFSIFVERTGSRPEIYFADFRFYP